MNQDGKISTKIKYIDQTKNEPKPTNKAHAIPLEDFNYHGLINKCRQQFKAQCTLVLQYEDGTINLQEPTAFAEIVANVKKGKAPVFICRKINVGQASNIPASEVRNKNQPLQNGSDTRKQGIVSAVKEYKPQLKEEQPPNQNNSISVSAKVDHSLNQSDINLDRSFGNKDHKEKRQLNHKSIDNIQPIKEEPESVREKNDRDLQESVQQIMAIYKQNKSETETRALLTKFMKKRMQKNEVRTKIDKDVKCFECNKRIERGPLYECLVCPGHLYFCSECEQKEKLSTHLHRAHPMAKIKYNSQFIKEKKVKIVDWTDVPTPESEDSSQAEKMSPIKNASSQKQYEVPKNPEIKPITPTKQKPLKKELAQSKESKSGRVNQMSELQREKKKCALKQIFNYSNDEVEKYMIGKYQSMSCEEILKEFDT